jgi:glycosyltransferase involved in cell wall biosynthesis
VSATAAWVATRFTGRPYSVVLHAFDLHSAHRRDRFSAVPLRDAAQVFTISECDRDLVARQWGISAEVLRMGVSDEWFATPPLPVHDRAPLSVVAVGSLVAKKGHDVLIDAVARTREPWVLDIIGEGPERRALEQRIAAAGLSGRARLLGLRPEAEVRDRLRRASVAALACVVAPDGDRDGIPVALMEAMACGTPVVSTRVGAIAELVGDAGVLVPAGDASALACALDALADPGLRSTMGTRARERVAREFRASHNCGPVVALTAGA